MLAKIEFPYGSGEKFQAMAPEDYAELRSVIDELPAEQHTKHFYVGACIVDVAEAGPLLTKHGISFEVKKMKGLMPVGLPVPSLGNQPVHIHVPNIGLLSMTEVTWLEDACTEVLQSHLDEGWRILAVCPPNCQRRPDYILGRAKSTA